MSLINNILFPVDFSPSCVAMGLYVKRAAAMYGAKVSLIHVFDPASYSGRHDAGSQYGIERIDMR